MAWIDNNARALLCIALALIILMVGSMIWGKLHPLQPVVFESQQQASTPAGVEKAANDAQVPISQAQAIAIAAVIKQFVDKPPDAVVQTTGAKLEATIKAELKKSGGQFAIVSSTTARDGNQQDASSPGKCRNYPGQYAGSPQPIQLASLSGSFDSNRQ